LTQIDQCAAATALLPWPAGRTAFLGPSGTPCAGLFAATGTERKWIGRTLIVTAAILVLALAGAILGSIVVCALKGKWGMVTGGLVIHILWSVGAIRLAKPNSWWARRYYGPRR
jgi:hypothetical protein